MLLQFERLTDHLRVAAEAPAPEAVTEQRGGIGFRRAVFVRRKYAPDYGSHAEQRKVTGRNHLYLQTLRVVRAGQVVGLLRKARDGGEALILVAQDLEARVRPV